MAESAVTREDLSDIRQVTLALDCSALNLEAIRIAVALASASGARLRAVFVEDQCLYHLAGLPMAREVSHSGRDVRDLEVSRIRAEIARSAAAARRAVAHAATRAHVEWVFDTMRGMVDEALGKVSRDAEVLALGGGGTRAGCGHEVVALRASLRHGTGVLVTPKRVLFERGPLVAVIGSGVHVASMVRGAEQLARRLLRPHRFIVATHGVDLRADLFEAVEAAMNVEAEVIPATGAGLANVTWAVRRQRAGFVMADIDHPMFGEVAYAERATDAFAAPLLLMQY